MIQQPFRQTVVVFGQDGKEQDQTEFPGVLKAALRPLANSVSGLSLGPAVTPDLLNFMKVHLSSGLAVGGHRYVVVVCVPQTPSPGGKMRYRHPFFALAEKGHGDRVRYPEHKDCTIALLEEF